MLGEIYRCGVRVAGLVITEDEDQRGEYNWSAGAWSFQQENKDFKTHILRLQRFDDERLFRAWFKKAKPAVIIGSASYIPIEKWLKNIGEEAGKTVGYALLDVEPDKEGVIAGLRQNSFDIGRESIRLISQAIYDNIPGLPKQPVTVLIDPEFVDGHSLDCLPNHI